jgi:phosphoribosyl-ATP pyrophosphohydrolase
MPLQMPERLEQIIAERRASPQPSSYTNSLMAAGRPRIAQKVGEEAVEVVIAALSQPRDLQIGEISDLVYHLLVLLNELGISLDEIDAELARRHGG